MRTAVERRVPWRSVLLGGLVAGTLISVMTLGWVAAQRRAISFPSVAPFELVERSGRTITDRHLRGRVWIAGLTFNCCTMSCPQVREAMRRLQEDLRHTDVRLVSISVDPAHDSPSELRRMADAIGAEPQRWLFLTAPPGKGFTYVNRLIEASFQTRAVFDPEAEPGRRVAHTSRLFLVDQQGRVRGSYAVVSNILGENQLPTDAFRIDEQELARLRHDADALDGGPLRSVIRLGDVPTLNAILNGSGAILLLLGYCCIRRRAVALHRFCMLSAVAVSAVFLAGYLYYHFYHGATPFLATGWIRPVYFVVLITHTGLAAIVLPLVVVTLWRAFHGQWQQHRRIARWTLPIWAYVSVTGVVVYFTLYHLYPA